MEGFSNERSTFVVYTELPVIVQIPDWRGPRNRPAFTAALIRSRVRSESESEKNW